MKRFLVVFFVLLVVSGAWADTAVQADQNSGFLDVATPSFTVGTTSKTDVGALLPGGCRGFMLYSYGGETLLNNTSDLAVAGRIGYSIASGSYVKWESRDMDPLRPFKCHAIAVTATTTCVLVAW